MSGSRIETPPEWLTESYLEEVLRKGLNKENLKILKSDVKMATEAGENFSSHLFRIKLINSSEEEGNTMESELSIIVKTLFPGPLRDNLRKWKVFSTEIQMLSTVLPEVHRILKRVDVQEKQFWPDCYHAAGEPNEILILEDLQSSGFVLGNRMGGLDMDHSTLALQSMAKLHAASLVIKIETPDAFDHFMSPFWSKENSESIAMFLKPALKMFSNEVLNWEDFEKRDIYSEKLKVLEETFVEKAVSAWIREDSSMNVLLHGDCSVNNFMFKYLPSGGLSEIKFIDFQLSCWNSPVIDLQYFIFTSTAADLKFSKVDEFLRIYYETFSSTLKKLNYPSSYSFEDLKEAFEHKYSWGLVVFCVVFPIITQSKENAVNAEEFLNETNSASVKGKYLRNETRKAFETGLAFFEEKGVF